jgi:hypothetical protein
LEQHHLRAAVRILEPGETLELTRLLDERSGTPSRRAVDRALARYRGESERGDQSTRRASNEPRPPQ